MPLIIYRVAEDGLSRECWGFRTEAGGTEELRFALTHYAIERRNAPKGRFAGAGPADRWTASDERSYTSGLPRPTSIPDGVRSEVFRQIVPSFYIGWFNEASAV